MIGRVAARYSDHPAQARMHRGHSPAQAIRRHRHAAQAGQTRISPVLYGLRSWASHLERTCEVVATRCCGWRHQEVFQRHTDVQLCPYKPGVQDITESHWPCVRSSMTGKPAIRCGSLDLATLLRGKIFSTAWTAFSSDHITLSSRDASSCLKEDKIRTHVGRLQER